MIKRKNQIASCTMLFSGVLLLISCKFAEDFLDNHKPFLIIILVCAFSLIIASGIFRSVKCHCPHCGAGKLFQVTTYYLKCDTLKNKFTCPECGKEVIID